MSKKANVEVDPKVDVDPIAAHRRLVANHSQADHRRDVLEQEFATAQAKLEDLEARRTVTAETLVEEENARRRVKHLEREIARSRVAMSQFERDAEATKAAHDDACEERYGMAALAAFAERADSATEAEIAEKMREHDALFADGQSGSFWSRQPKTLPPRERFRRGAAECKESAAKVSALKGIEQRQEERLRLILALSNPAERVELEQQMSAERAADNAAFFERFGERPTPSLEIVTAPPYGR